MLLLTMEGKREDEGGLSKQYLMSRRLTNGHESPSSPTAIPSPPFGGEGGGEGECLSNDRWGIPPLTMTTYPPVQHAVLAKTATFLGVTGTLQAQQGVVHLIAEQLWKPRVGRQPAIVSSRNFH